MANFIALIVEDDAGLRLIYERLVREQGFDTLEASNGEDAINLLRRHRPQLIFLDMLLPMVSGVQVIEFMLENLDVFGQTHIAIVSSNKIFEQYVAQLPWAQFVLKPILPNQIRQIARDVTVTLNG